MAALAAALAGVGGVGGGAWSKDAATDQVAAALDPLAHRVEVLDGRLRRLEWSTQGGCLRMDDADHGPPAPAVALPRLRPVR